MLEYQIEMLRKHLGDKVKGIHLGSSELVRDPFSREFDKKPIKPFMVNQTVLILERGQLRIPSPEVDETIFRQMINYQVEKISPKTGEPTYSSKDEHALDAMMLSLLAFIKEMPDIAQTIEDVKAARTVATAKIKLSDPIAMIHRGDGRKDDYKSYLEKWDEPTPPPPIKTQIDRRSQSGSFTWGSRGTRKTFYSRSKW